MTQTKQVLLIAAVFLSAVVANGSSTAIHQEVLQTYNFQPHTLSSSEITRKSGVLDLFWAKAKAQPNIYVPALRQELEDVSNPPFFLYDGSMLLLTLSDTSQDRKIALTAIAHSDLRDVQTKDYFLQVHRMATLEEDTTEAAFHILEKPDFKVFIPQHVLTLGQNYALVYMLLPTSQDYWLGRAIAKLRTEHDETSQRSLILLLWYAQTDAADNAIAAFAADAKNPTASRDYANQMVQMKKKIPFTQKTEAVAFTQDSLRQKRRERMKAVSDEALIDLDDYTMMLAAKRK